ncbi:MAG: DegV family EDD domain-containing protein [Candidatus Cloacimonetes bacterium]|nr:DegV family EDD domain-containing protein [Candidatus Cloacimonadota bacterium]
MKNKILLITGDNLGIANDQIDFKDIAYLKFPVLINDEEYRESEEHTALYLIERFKKEKVSAHTQALVKGDLIKIVESAKDHFDIIIHVLMGSNMSAATFQMSEQVRKEYAEIISIINIDTKQVISGVGSILLRLIDLLKTSDDIEEITAKITEITASTFTYLCLPDLGFLQRGGRIGKAKSLLGSILKTIPVVGLLGDEADLGILPIGKGRTKQATNKLIIENIKQKMKKYKIEKVKQIIILHVEDNDSPELKDLEAQIKRELKFERLIIGHPRFCEAVHTGPGAWIATFSLK